ncbi:anti-sigma factor family protein [Saccharopolyspora spinosa]|uniref:Zinc finger protein n=1 Tax=Saccharopolyspora spinosa TaxID=60894 RepID=A0A2N3Y2I6_SACSN|nr:zf-HC2 domain-containing protein [Saccharopolyspora spinosa]PKW17122.1 putative zinc finger protein [Saccharopolyspora spinosa]
MSRHIEPGADPFETFDAAYVLGALSPEDRAAFESHLSTCDSCADSVRLLAGLPGLLAQVDEHHADVEPPPPDRLPKLLAEVQRLRRHRLLATVSAVLVGAAACLVLMLSLLLTDRTAGEEMTALGAYPVQASINLSDVSTGTRVDMSCSYEGTKGGDYMLVTVQRDGRTAELARWYALPQNTASLDMTTPLRRNEIQSLEIRIPDGPAVLRLVVNE